MSELMQYYAAERARLSALAAADEPAGEYAHPVFGSGNPKAALLLIGEAPGAEETKQGKPFVGKAGKQLSELLELMRLTRDEIYITNTVKYRPVVRSEKTVRNRTPGRGEIASSLPLMKNEILSVRPAVIATLGNTPLGAVLLLANERKNTVGELHGRTVSIKIDGYETTLVPLYHPASGIYNRDLIPVMRQDAAFLGEHLVK